jgi:GLPGLI family protein
MNVKITLLLFLLAGQCMLGKTVAQVKNRNLTIVYDITVNKTKKSSGIEETYNGGTRAVFISNKKIRVRLVSLMRIESIFFDYDTSTLKQATIIKESGKKKYLVKLTPEAWDEYNSKYKDATCDIKDDSVNIAGYPCRRAIVNLSSGEQIETFFTDSIPKGNPFIDPAFSCIPGTVLQYEYTSKRGTITFKASQVKKGPIAKDVFVMATAGVEKRKLTGKKTEEIEEEEN